jgi:hypothetical protein
MFAAVPALAADPPDALIKVMMDQNASWKERISAEDSLATLPPEAVLPALLPHLYQGAPPGGIWNSGGQEADRQAPPGWQVFYAVSRSWSGQVRKLHSREGGALLLELLGRASTTGAKNEILRDLVYCWAPEAEPAIAALLRDPFAESSVRTTAALVLNLNGKENYQNLLLEFAARSSHADRKLWFGVLSDPRYKKRRGIDPRVISMGFELIESELRVSPGYVHGAYFLAGTTGDYAAQNFMPDQNDPRYRSETGLKDAFFEDTVKNALDWWQRNRDKQK